MEFTYKTLTMPQISDWCIANGELEWIKNAYKEREFPVYPTEKHTITRGKKKGEVIERVIPNSNPIGVEKREPTTREIITEFAEHFSKLGKLPANFFPKTAAVEKVTAKELFAAIGTPEYETIKAKYEAYQKLQKDRAKARKAKNK